MRRNKNGKTVPQDLFVFLVLGLLAAVLAAVVHLLYHTEYAETSTPNDCFAAVSATATGETAVPKIVCLTFDDGPSAHTPEILDILEKEHVPATFFVCAQDANEAHLDKIADIAAAGHQIALHSASHQYSKIYRSTDAFWQDIKELRQAISPYVDADSLTWLRFPGGSTNTVSHKYGGSGIMKRLKAQAEERGLDRLERLRRGRHRQPPQRRTNFAQYPAGRRRPRHLRGAAARHQSHRPDRESPA